LSYHMSHARASIPTNCGTRRGGALCLMQTTDKYPEILVWRKSIVTNINGPETPSGIT
jgi:hypothetical protein